LLSVVLRSDGWEEVVRFGLAIVGDGDGGAGLVSWIEDLQDFLGTFSPSDGSNDCGSILNLYAKTRTARVNNIIYWRAMVLQKKTSFSPSRRSDLVLCP
jgi:hypothetical protein